MISKKICIFQPTSSLIQQSVFDKYAMANMKLVAVHFKGEDGEFHLLGLTDQMKEEIQNGIR